MFSPAPSAQAGPVGLGLWEAHLGRRKSGSPCSTCTRTHAKSMPKQASLWFVCDNVCSSKTLKHNPSHTTDRLVHWSFGSFKKSKGQTHRSSNTASASSFDSRLALPPRGTFVPLGRLHKGTITSISPMAHGHVASRHVTYVWHPRAISEFKYLYFHIISSSFTCSSVVGNSQGGPVWS